MLLTIYNSKRDTYGNTHWAFRLTHCGKILSNSTVASNNFNTRDLSENGIEYVFQELPVREFNRLTKDWQYAGCRWEDIRQRII